MAAVEGSSRYERDEDQLHVETEDLRIQEVIKNQKYLCKVPILECWEIPTFNSLWSLVRQGNLAGWVSADIYNQQQKTAWKQSNVLLIVI